MVLNFWKHNERPRPQWVAAVFFAIAEAVVTPAAGVWLSLLPHRCQSPTEVVLNVGVSAGLQEEAKALGFSPGGLSRLANWMFGGMQIGQNRGLIRWCTWAIALLLLVLLWRTRVLGSAGVSMWCALGAWFFAEKLLSLPLDKAIAEQGPKLVAVAAVHSLLGLTLYGTVVFLLVPLSRAQRLTALKCGLIFAVVVVVYNANLRPLGTGDTFAAPYVSLSLVRAGDFDLDEFEWARGDFRSIDPKSNGAVRAGGRIVSKYPATSSLLATPLFATFLFVPWLGFPDNEFLLSQIGKLAATIFAALSVVGVYLAIRGTRPRWAAFVACVYAFCTCTWFVSQALWQHPACEMALAIALCCLVRAEKDRRFLAPAGFALALALAARHASVAIVAGLGAYALCRHRRDWARLAIGALPVIVFQLAYDCYHFGSPLTTGYQAEARSAWQTPLAYGLVGHLIGPSRGLLIFSPFLAFAAVGLRAAWQKRRDSAAARLVLASGVAAAGHLLLLSKWHPWHGGLSYGYRMVVEVCPLLVFVLAFGLDRVWRSKAWRTTFVVLVVVAAGIQAVGILAFDGRWEMDTAATPQQHRSIRNSQILHYVRRNRWYFVSLRHAPRLHLHQTAYQITVNGLQYDASLDYPRAYLFEDIQRRPTKPSAD